jgi:hypothetical protein
MGLGSRRGRDSPPCLPCAQGLTARVRAPQLILKVDTYLEPKYMLTARALM